MENVCERDAWSVTQILPENEQVVMAYGHETICCSEDMDKEADWHMVKFRLHVSSYKLKKEMPFDIEESILETYQVTEEWEGIDDGTHLIGVSKWKKL